MFVIIKFRHSIVASIPACHAGDQGSIPCDGGIFLPFYCQLFFLLATWTGFVTLNFKSGRLSSTLNSQLSRYGGMNTVM